MQTIFFSASAGTELCRLSSSPPLLVWNSSVCLLQCFCWNRIVQIIFSSAAAGIKFFSFSSSPLLLELNIAHYLLLCHCQNSIVQIICFSTAVGIELCNLWLHLNFFLCHRRKLEEALVDLVQVLSVIHHADFLSLILF